MALILAAAAFMIQRLATHWRIRRARREGRAAIAQLQSAGALTATFGDESLSLDVDGRTLLLAYADCEEAEDAGGLIYVWPRDGAPDRRADSRACPCGGGGAPCFPLSGRIGDMGGARVSPGEPAAIAPDRPQFRRDSDASAGSAPHGSEARCTLLVAARRQRAGGIG